MALTLAKLATNTASLSIPYQGETINLTYRPGRVTDAVLTTVDKTLEERTQVLCDLIVSWDVCKDEAETEIVPITPEGMAELPSDLKLRVARAILKDVRDHRPETEAA